jgi:hypothetical protein
MTRLKSIAIVALPFFASVFIVSVVLKVIVFDTSRSLSEKSSNLQKEVQSLRQSVERLSNSSTVEKETFVPWPNKSVGGASLDLQAKISNLATIHSVPQHLLGPYSEKNGQDISLFSIEFESETELPKAVAFFSALDDLTPWVSVAELDIRPINGFEESQSETHVYFRVIIQGVYDASVE